MSRPTLIRRVSLILLTAVLTVGHFLYSFWLSVLLYHRSGGIQKLPTGWTSYGGADHAWTIPLQIPGTLLLEASNHSWPALAPFGGLLLLVASVVTAYAVSEIIIDLCIRHRPSWGRFYWRAAAIMFGLAWIPIREDYALVYQYTVRF